MSNDPMHQFHIEKFIPMDIGGFDISFSNASLFLLIGAAVPAALMLASSAKPAIIPGRMQSFGEGVYKFVYGNLYSAAGEKGAKMFMPFVLTLFTFIASMNLIGLWAFNFTPTAQIIVTASMALMVFLTVIIVGFVKSGLGFFKLFFPSGVPWPLYFIVTPIEIVSFFSRPLSHAVRLWANVFAGHVLVKVFAGFVPVMIGAGFLGALGSTLPFAMTVALYGLETLVALVQAFVFSLLTCLYLNDALHAGHH